MKFKNETHLFNAYKKTIREFGVELSKEELEKPESECKDVFAFVKWYGNSMALHGLKMGIYEMFWSTFINCKNKSNAEILKNIHIFTDILNTWSITYELPQGDRLKKYRSLIRKLKKHEGDRKACKYTKENLSSFNPRMPKETLIAFNRASGESGVYLLYNDKEELMYVGKSKSLSTRIMQSLRERECSSFSYAILNECDYHVMEMYLIMLWRPPLNQESKTKDKLTFEIPLPNFSGKYKALEWDESLEENRC